MDPNSYADYTKLYANERIDGDYQKEVASVMGNVDNSIKNLEDEKYAMNRIVNKTLDRENNYTKYSYNKTAYNIDLALTFLLNRIASIDGGPDAKTYLKENHYELEHESNPKV